MRIYKRIAAVVFATALLSGAAFYSVSETNVRTPQEVFAAGFSDLSFKEGPDHNSAMLAKCNPDAEGYLEIPSTYNGIPVRYIDEKAFAGCGKLTSVYIPSGIEYIGERAFLEAVSLKSVEIPDTVRELPQELFAGCSALQEVKLNDGIVSIGKNVFQDCKMLRELTIPKTVERIDADILKGCQSMQTITILNPDCLLSSFGTYSLMVRGYANSTADRLARGEGYSFEPIDGIPAEPVFCDASGDGEVTALDAQYVLEYYLESMLGNEPSWKEITGNENAPS